MRFLKNVREEVERLRKTTRFWRGSWHAAPKVQVNILIFKRGKRKNTDGRYSVDTNIYIDGYKIFSDLHLI